MNIDTFALMLDFACRIVECELQITALRTSCETLALPRDRDIVAARIREWQVTRRGLEAEMDLLRFDVANYA